MTRISSLLEADGRLHRLAAVGFGLTAAALIELGLVDDMHHGAHAAGWRLDEFLFLLLAVMTGAMLAERVARGHLARDAARRAAEERAAHDLAHRDPLTGLLNRRGLDAAATRALGEGARRFLFLADLDGFKGVNDAYGHATGDDVLKRFAERLRALPGPTARVDAARLGGDEFIVVVESDGGGGGDDLGRRFGRRIAATIELDARSGEPLSVGVSTGVAAWPASMDLEAALEQADAAMYEAKRTGAGLCRFDQLQGDAATGDRPADRVFERKLATLPDPASPMCVAAIGLDRYHNARRTLGYGFAARLVRALRERLEDHRPSLLIERIGPDTLGLLFPAGDMAQALTIMKALNAVATQSYEMDGLVIDSPLTIGMAGPAPASRLRETVEQAHCALDEARRTGRRQVVFDLREQHRAAQNIRLMNEMKAAIAADRLQLHYQPKLCARTGEIDSMEALVRWPHPERGFVSPGEFVPIAEESGDIRALTWWVLGRAIGDQARLEALGVARPIYVNVSAQLIGDPEFAERLLATLDGHAGRIGIEITETAVLGDPERALAHLRRLADAGIKIAIDDYGVGLSSLSYLKQLPATELKIDMMFITDLADSHRDPMIVRSTIDLAHGLGLRVTAEGVDKPESQALLRIMGCDMLQGYQFAKAMPLGELTAFLLGHEVKAETVPDCATQLMAFING